LNLNNLKQYFGCIITYFDNGRSDLVYKSLNINPLIECELGGV